MLERTLLLVERALDSSTGAVYTGGMSGPGKRGQSEWLYRLGVVVDSLAWATGWKPERVALAAVVVGYFRAPLSVLARVVMAGASVALIFPGVVTGGAGLFILIIFWLIQGRSNGEPA